jgi:cell division protein FtsB
LTNDPNSFYVLCEAFVVLFLRLSQADNQLRKRRSIQPRLAAPARRIVRLLLLVVAAAVLADVFVGDQGLLAMMRARRQYDELAASIARQRAENARLREQARRLRDDPAAVEEIARRELGLIRPGEKVFIIKDLPQPSKPLSNP